MYLKIVFLLLCALAFSHLSTAEPTEVMKLACELAKENVLWLPVANRKCITGCLKDSHHTILILNRCTPDLAPGEPEQPFYKDGFCRKVTRSRSIKDFVENKLKGRMYCVDNGLPSAGLVLVIA
ncbi:hypothetical protein Bhyg_11289 [Pseudolycoriella hygida]|uniref:Uncharacterized protein n=1 Tax=Pseudolycoriella hygida TaxID=35572 RepID=A0A9Q0RZG5_9DIPT|nr:hypothetical protein Bhyg_11289 [Pseudolycoriella hygida]